MENQKLENENQPSSNPVHGSQRQDVEIRQMVWSFQFDPLSSERGVEITYGGKACAVAPTLNNAVLLIDRLNRHDALLVERKALLSALKEILNFGVEFDDERLSYVVAHLDRDAVENARAAISLATGGRETHEESGR